MNNSKALIAVLVMAVVTYLIRAIPLTVVRGKIRSPWLQSFLYYVPYTVLGAMVFPAILYSTGNIYGASAGFVVAMILAFSKQNLLVVAIGGVVTGYLVGLFR